MPISLVMEGQDLDFLQDDGGAAKTEPLTR